MKKTLLPLLAFILLFNFGCKKDETSGNPSGFIKSITFNHPGEVYKSSYEYDSQKRVKKIIFHEDNDYNGYNVVTYNSDGTIKIVEGFDPDDIKVEKVVFSYTENQLTMIYSYYDDFDEAWYDESKEIIDYNTNKLIVKYEYYEKYSENWTLDESESFEWSNNNLVKETAYYTFNKRGEASKKNHRAIILKAVTGKSYSNFAKTKVDADVEYTKTYQFDTKNNPAWDFNAASYSSPTGIPMLSKNNPISSEKIYSDYPSENYTETFTYEYNENNFPTLISVSSSYSENITKSIEYDYQVEIEYY